MHDRLPIFMIIVMVALGLAVATWVLYALIVFVIRAVRKLSSRSRQEGR
jgi:hypothetical protein